MERTLFAVSLVAWVYRGSTQRIEQRAGSVWASNVDEAVGMGTSYVLDIFPVDDGWEGHMACVSEIDLSIYASSAAAAGDEDGMEGGAG